MSVIFHHYVDGAPSTLIEDAPYAKSVTKAASRIFAAYGETVKYCKAGDARDWTTTSDAGFLPVQLQQDTGDACVAVGTYQNKLAVLFPSSVQTWVVAVDPSTNAIDQRLYGVGSLAPLTLGNFANDLAFLSPFGFRSMTVRSQTDQVDDLDIGVQVDGLVKETAKATELLGVNALDPVGLWIHEIGQYWCVFDEGSTSKIWACSYSKTSKIACWSEYELPIRIQAIASLNGKVYLRDENTLYEWDASTYTDNGTSIPVEVQMAFQNAKTPGVDKQIYGADAVLEGTAQLSFKYDPRDLGKESIPQSITGDSSPGQFIPVEIVATSIAPVIRHEADEKFEFTQLSIFWNSLAVT